MNAPGVEVFTEADLVELLRDEPELLAVADSIAQTQGARGGLLRFRRSALAGAALAAAVVSLLVASPWQRGHAPSLVDRALAAVGRGPVLHSVIELDIGLTSIDLASGHETPVPATMETWFDTRRQIEHSVTRIDGRIQDEAVRTPTGVVGSWGAARGGPAPVLDPALAKSVDGYRAALASGEAKLLGDGMIDGHSVSWLELTPGDGSSERVAIDKDSSEPVRVEMSWKSGATWTYNVRSIEGLPEGSGNFQPPTPPTGPRPQSFMREPTQISPADATAVIPGALATGSAFQGLPLTKVIRAKLSTLFEPRADKEPVISSGLEFDYGSNSLVDGRPYLWISEATQPNSQYGWRPGLVPPSGDLLVVRSGAQPSQGGTGLMVKNGIYLSISASTRGLMLGAARALRPYASS